MRSAIFDQLLRLSMTFYDRNQVGRVMSRAQSDVQQVQGVMNIGWLAISETFILAGVAAGMLAMDIRLGVLSLVTVVLIFPVVIFWQKFARAAYVRARQTMADVNAKLQENLTAVRVVQSLGLEQANLQSFDEANRESEKASIEATKFGAALMPSVEALNAIGLALVISIGGMLALGGSIEVGVLVAFTLYITRFFEPVERLTGQYNVLQRAIVSTSRIFEVMDIRPLLQDRPGAPALPPVKGAIRYEGVEFHYFEDRPVLRGVDLRIEPGETVALVGPTGAGKTTLVSLLMRFYDAKAGRITIDGHDLRDVTLDSLSRTDGRRAPGAAPVRGHGCREHQVLPHRRAGRGDVPRGARRGHPRLHHGAGEGLRHDHRGGREQPQRRPAAAHELRPRAGGRSENPHPRRGDRQH